MRYLTGIQSTPLPILCVTVGTGKKPCNQCINNRKKVRDLFLQERNLHDENSIDFADDVSI